MRVTYLPNAARRALRAATFFACSASRRVRRSATAACVLVAGCLCVSVLCATAPKRSKRTDQLPVEQRLDQGPVAEQDIPCPVKIPRDGEVATGTHKHRAATKRVVQLTASTARLGRERLVHEDDDAPCRRAVV
jgi:hypothetical protein